MTGPAVDPIWPRLSGMPGRRRSPADPLFHVSRRSCARRSFASETTCVVGLVATDLSAGQAGSINRASASRRRGDATIPAVRSPSLGAGEHMSRIPEPPTGVRRRIRLMDKTQARRLRGQKMFP